MKLHGHDITWADVTTAIRRHIAIPEPELVEAVLRARHTRRLSEIQREIDTLMEADQTLPAFSAIDGYLRRQDRITRLFAEHARTCDLAYPTKP